MLDRGCPRDFIAAFGKGLAVIQAFSESTPALTLSGVAQRTGLTRATARRFLLTLESLGFAERLDGKLFVLTPRVLLLGHAYLSSMPMWRFAEPVLERLVEDIGETCSLSVLDGTEVVYVLRIPVHRVLNRISTVGSRLPAYCTSMGRLLLSSLPEDKLDAYLAQTAFIGYTDKTVADPLALRRHLALVRRTGYAWVSGEMEEHINGLAVPVHDANGKVIAALNVSVRRPEVDAEAFLRRTLPTLRRAAQRLSNSMIVSGSAGECLSAGKRSRRVRTPPPFQTSRRKTHEHAPFPIGA